MTERAREAAGPRIIFLKLPLLSHTPARKRKRPQNSFPLHSLKETRFPVTQQEGPLCGLLVILLVTGWPLPGTGAGRGDRETHLTACGYPHNCGILRCILAACSMAGPGGSPSRASNEELAGQPVGPLCTPAQNFMFVLSQEAHVSLVGREKRVGRPTGKSLSSFVPGGWVNTAEVKSG